MTQPLSPTALSILHERQYLQRSPEGKVIETPEELFHRIAHAVSLGEPAELQQHWEDKFYEMLSALDFLPNSPTITNAGLSHKGSLSACFVNSPSDHMESILQVQKEWGLIEKWGGGVGADFSALRPKGSKISTTHGKALGPVAAMRMYGSNAREITQGSFRQGAHMGQLSCLAGSTMISTLEGRIPIKDLVGQHPWLYCTDGQVVKLRRAESVFPSGRRVTVQVRFDDDSTLECTPDHAIMLSDGTFKEANQLQRGDSVKAFTKALAKITATLFEIRVGMTGQQSSTPEHIVAVEASRGRYPQKYVEHVHHVDENHLNNSPDNLVILSESEHGKLHTKTLKENQRKTAALRKGKKLDEILNSPTGKRAFVREQAAIPNHKVMSVTPFVEMDVYDISVPEFHNFVANSIFVHNCTHPDVVEFIHCKDDDKTLQNFNISVQITDDFMKAVADDRDWVLIDPHTNKIEEQKKLPARKLWKELCESAWKTGDPGVVFMNRVWETQPNPQLGDIRSSNPCGEENLENYGNCCLGSINLAHFVSLKGIDFNRLEKVVAIAVRFLDDVININEFPLLQLKEMNLKTRRIGLGVMGWADLLAESRVAYDSMEALSLATQVSKFIKAQALKNSTALAEERGPFLEWERSALNKPGVAPLRHSSVTTIAPTGTIARIADCSSGIEPYFALAWWSNILWEDLEGQKKKRVLDAIPVLRRELTNLLGKEEAQKLLETLADDPSFANRSQPISSLVDVYQLKTAMQVSARAHVEMQAEWQGSTTNSVSKTVNLANSATVQDVEEAFTLAWKLGCKSVTVYRDGSKSMQVLETGDTRKLPVVEALTPRPRPTILNSTTEKVRTGHGNMYVTITLDEQDKPFEVFAHLGKAGGCDTAYLEAVSRLCSLALRSGVAVERVVGHLQGITCHPTWDDGKQITSAADGIAKALERYVPIEGFIEEELHALTAGKATIVNTTIKSGNQCPSCSSNMVAQEGCFICVKCGYSKCS